MFFNKSVTVTSTYLLDGGCFGTIDNVLVKFKGKCCLTYDALI